MSDVERLKAAIREVPDFPEPGILFKDITPILNDPALFRSAIDIFEARHRNSGITKVAGIDARGFFFAAALCDRMGLGLVPIRKKGKLPFETFEQSYDLEYGSSTLAVHQDAFARNDRVLILDDLLATGGTALASAELIQKADAEVSEINFLVELGFLSGREKLAAYDVFAPILF